MAAMNPKPPVIPRGTQMPETTFQIIKLAAALFIISGAAALTYGLIRRYHTVAASGIALTLSALTLACLPHLPNIAGSTGAAPGLHLVQTIFGAIAIITGFGLLALLPFQIVQALERDPHA